jgi:hypothetical protein
MTQLEPKPKESTYCMVCRQHFRDYRTHILHQDHRRAIKAAVFQRDIHKLVRRMRKEREGRREAAGEREADGESGEGRRRPIAKSRGAR